MESEAADMLNKSRLAAQEYYGDLAYHNWDGHIETVLSFALREADILNELGVEIDMEVVQDAIYWHDADYDKDPEQYGFSSKEQLSAWLASEHLRDIGRSEEYIESVVRAISATELGHESTSNEAALVVAADMHNVAGLQRGFLHSSARIAAEQVQLGKFLPSDAAEFFQKSALFLELHLKGPAIYIARDGTEVIRSDYYQRALQNIRSIGKMGLHNLKKIPGIGLLLPEEWQDKSKFGQ